MGLIIGRREFLRIGNAIYGRYFDAGYYEDHPDFVSFSGWLIRSEGPWTKILPEYVNPTPNKDGLARITGPSVESLHAKLLELYAQTPR